MSRILRGSLFRARQYRAAPQYHGGQHRLHWQGMQGDGRSHTPRAGPAMRVRRQPDEEARCGRAMRLDRTQEDGREKYWRRHVARSPSPARAAEKRRPPTSSVARRWSKGASQRWIIQIAPAVYSWYTCRRHEAHSSWSCGLAMVAPQKHNRQPLCVCLSSADGL
jgi:hypothetical protein